VLKVNFGDDLRRISIADDCSYVELRKTLHSLFHRSLPPGFIIKYKDEEADVLSITSDSELQEAKTIHKQLLRLTLIAPPTGEKGNEKKPESATDNVQPKEESQAQSSPATPQANQLNFAPLLQELMQNTQLAQSLLPLVMSALGNSFQAGSGSVNPSNPSPQDPQASIQRLSEKLLSESCIQNLLSSVLPLAAQQAQNAAQTAAQVLKRHADQTTTTTTSATSQTDKPCELVTAFDPLPPTCPESPTTALVATSDPVVDPVPGPAPSTTVYIPAPEPEIEIETEPESASDSGSTSPILISACDPVHLSIDGGETVAKDIEDKKINDLAQMFGAPLDQLADLGFTDKFVNVSLLQKYNGDISRVLDALLDS